MAVGLQTNRMRTSDGGKTWIPLVGSINDLRRRDTWGKTMPTLGIVPPGINDRHCADATTPVAVSATALGSAESLIMRTTDGGGTWTHLPSPLPYAELGSVNSRRRRLPSAR
jgi:hypothetical protein